MIMRVIKVFIVLLAFGVLMAPHGVMAKVFGHKKVKARPKIIVVTLVKKISEMGCLEPLMIRAVVFKVDKNKKIVLARIVSETYRNETMVIKGMLHVKKGYYIDGALCGNHKFLITPFRGLK